ncbi:MAG: UDP-3-O-(3-hydroxymyristoyl)glucosamine N-acyltransferase [Acidobacteria bacterium]|nr:UDP-3-O-(3-hydroxymyristoyl)glucosamine N-acyltransferase [Acidobacteriota bacterium]
MSYQIKQIAAFLDLEYQGDGSRLLNRVSNWETADGDSLVFLDSGGSVDPESVPLQAGCIIAPRDLAPDNMNVVFSTQPKLDFARASSYLYPWPAGRGRRHPTAVVSKTAKIEEDVDLGPFAVVGADAKIGKGSIIYAGSIIERECCLGRKCIVHPGVVLYPGSQLGDRVILHAGVVVGGDGFGYVSDGESRVKFPQVGSVILEDDVEVGCNTTIDRGSLGTTRIRKGAKIDNLVQIAHNVDIGRNVVIASQTGISGSTIIEDDAVIGGQVGFGDHVRVQKGVVIGSKAGVLPGKIVRSGEVYWGVPVRPLREYKRLNAHFSKLPEMKAEIDTLKKKVSRLQAVLRKK